MGINLMDLRREELAGQTYLQMEPKYDYRRYQLVKDAWADDSVVLSPKKQNGDGHGHNGNGKITVPIDTLYLDYFTLRTILIDSQASSKNAPAEFKPLAEAVKAKATSQLKALDGILQHISPGFKIRFLDYVPEAAQHTSLN